MISLQELDPLKLVTDENNIARDDQAMESFARAVDQGSQGWGVGMDEAVLLRFATELSRALALSEKYEETQKALKAEQMRRGRTAKSLDAAQVANDDLRAANEMYGKRIAELEETLEQVRADLSYAHAQAEDESA